MKVKIERGIDEKGNNFCNWDIGDYKNCHGNFSSGSEYSALVEKIVGVYSTLENKTRIAYGDYSKTFDFPVVLDIKTQSFIKIQSGLIQRKNQILNWINSLPVKESIEFEV